jgi:nicotinamidase/pyrazinamidase
MIDVLLAVDPTNTFCPGGELPVPEGDAIMPVLNNLAQSRQFAACVLITEAHPSNHCSFAINSADGRTGWPIHSLVNTPQCEPHPDLDATRFQYRVIKGLRPNTECYGAFADSAGTPTPLMGVLGKIARQAGVPLREIRLAVTGLATDYCVATTAQQALERGFITQIVLDACRGISPATELKALRDLVARGALITTSARVLGRERQMARGIELAA